MRAVTRLVAIGCILAVASVALAEAAQPVLKVLPAGSLGYVVVSDIGKTTTNVDKYLTAIGVKDILGEAYPGALEFVKAQAQIGEGLDTKGGVAIVMLDPQQFGFDVANPGEKKPPVVVYVAGNDPKSVFAAYKQEPGGKDNKYTVISFRSGAMFAAKSGGYIVMSPVEEALTTALAAKKTADTELSKTAAEILAKADLAGHANMKIAGPIYMKLMKEQMTHGMGPGAGIMKLMTGMYEQVLADMDAITVSARIEPKGLVIDEIVDILPDSAMGKATAAAPTTDKPLLDALPNYAYVLAAGGLASQNKAAREATLKMVDDMLKDKSMADVPEATKTKAKAVVTGLSEQVTGTQIVIGGAPAGNGQLGVAIVIKCNDSAKVTSLLADAADVATTMVQTTAGEEGKKITFTYGKGAAGKFDSITVTGKDVPQEAKTQMKAVLGDDTIRMLVSAADKSTVVLTLGGSTAMMDATVKTATTAAGTIGTGDEMKDALANMPKKLTGMGVFHVANLLDLISNIQKATEPESMGLPIKMTTKLPIVIGAGVAGTSIQETVYIPNEVVKDGVTAAMGAMMPMPGGKANPGRAPRKPMDEGGDNL